MIKLMFRVIPLIVFVMISSCQTENKDVSYKELLNLNSTHEIKKSILTKTLNEVLNDTVNYSKYDYPILLIISEKLSTKYKVCVSKTDYNIFKSSRPDTFSKLIGYSIYKDIPVLLFGDSNKNVITLENIDFYNVLGKMPEYGRGNPPIIFEPRMKCYEEKW
ncbi:hypothetical protein ACHRVK_15595 [Flavobacterium plurextorum]|uniref:hypothetical protein n=1 Tax=Flavobacterium TaxID=237 RepID=UPI00214DBC89|nr:MULTISPECIES: hypothetical protein [Flavobacterium]UUW11021.1 hypothetical protein NLG42_09435 [Flavobacterium plurextorum]